MFILSLLLAFILGFYQLGCDTTQPMDPIEISKKTYRKSLKFEVNGKNYEGIAVLQREPTYKIIVKPLDKMDFYLFQTVHRTIPMEKPNEGWFKSKNVEYTYSPQPMLEDRGYVPLEIAALRKDQVKDQVGFIAFDDREPEVSLGANVRCNGDFIKRDGTTVCQAKTSSIEQIFFMTEVVFKGTSPGCSEPKSTDGFFWDIIASSGECSYKFISNLKHKNGKRLAHRFILIGWDSLRPGE